ncbi:MAG: hypothetical protein H6806_07305 [Planctomycetes bacterium]|nr:hypothetical protein [Planctomycetota bacterium]
MAHRGKNDRLMDGDLPLQSIRRRGARAVADAEGALGTAELGSVFPTAGSRMTGFEDPWLVQDVLLRGGVTYLYGD